MEHIAGFTKKYPDKVLKQTELHITPVGQQSYVVYSSLSASAVIADDNENYRRARPSGRYRISFHCSRSRVGS
ncbi:unnamed protein product [Arctia plantaginis]|uniref:Uncharacterized protein n=1 Tax=Arctia plantaginis TaxID=874455 RepID=A0A8S1BAN4_ARCPL|nr:unnamed protein product [Arctia plantaginis]